MYPTEPHFCLLSLPQIWRIENLELVPVDTKWRGHFYGGDCYLLLYTYLVGEKKHYLLYIWQVRTPVPHCEQPGSWSTLFSAEVANTTEYPHSPLGVL